MKDQTRNIETFKVGATRINEFDFHKHQAEMHELNDQKEGPGIYDLESKAERVAENIKNAHERVARRKKRH
jgi:hypothetical protein